MSPEERDRSVQAMALLEIAMHCVAEADGLLRNDVSCLADDCEAALCEMNSAVMSLRNELYPST